MKMYLAGWNHYPEGRIRNALYMHLLDDDSGLTLDNPVTTIIKTATEAGFREVSYLIIET